MAAPRSGVSSSNTKVEGHVTLEIDGTNVTLTTSDLTSKPLVFSLPKGASYTVSLSHLNSFLQSNKFIGSAISLPSSVTAANVTISKLMISSLGILDIELGVSTPEGWSIFSGLKLDDFGFSVEYIKPATKAPTITGLATATGSAKTEVVVSGTNLGLITEATFGGVQVPSITQRKDGCVTLEAPKGPSGSVLVQVTNAAGESSSTKAEANTFTYSGS